MMYLIILQKWNNIMLMENLNTYWCIERYLEHLFYIWFYRSCISCCILIKYIVHYWMLLFQGSTRAFPPYHPLIPVDYQLTGQPVLIGGTMGTCSYVLTGTEQGMNETFGSTCHGAVSDFYFFNLFICLIVI